MIESIHDVFWSLLRDVVEPFFFWQVLPESGRWDFYSAHRIRMGKIDIGRERLGYFLMLGKLLTVVIKERRLKYMS